MIALKPGVVPTEEGSIRVFLPAQAVNDSDQREFVANLRYEDSVSKKTPGRHLLDDIAFKADFVRTFDLLKPRLAVAPGQNVLELGACHGWASVIVKDDCPGAYVVAADLVPAMMAHCQAYERLVGPIDEKWGFSVRDIPFADAQFDRIFTFASFHHFGDHGDYSHSMKEISRILKPGGKLVLLYEPAAPAYMYKPAFRRVNRKREQDGVDEDVLVASRLEVIARRLGLKMTTEPFPIYQYRTSPLAGMYYLVLSKLHLGSALVSTTNFVFEKPAS